MKIVFICCIALTLISCKPPQLKKKASGKKPAAAKKSTMQTAVDGFTGRTAVKSGKHAQEKIREISAQKDEDLSAVLGD